MPAMPKGEDGYTDKQRAFISEFVSIGERNGTKACIAAGYSESSAYQRAHELLQDDHILEGIAKERRKQYQSSAAVAKRILQEMLEDDTQPSSVRKDIALALIDRAGDKHAEKQEVTTHSPEQKQARIEELTAKIAPQLKVVDGK